MASTTNHTSSSTQTNFSFASSSPWIGPDVATMRVQSRARVIQSQQRADRLRRKNTSLKVLLEAAYAHRMIEDQISRQEHRPSGPSLHDSQADRAALQDLAVEGARQSAQATPASPERSTMRHLRAIAKMAALEDLDPIDTTASQQELDLRDRSALLDLRREHGIEARTPVKILRDTQPRSAVSSRRWG